MNKHPNNICICGHSREIHNPSYSKHKMWPNSSYRQDACYEGLNEEKHECRCMHFKQDNLKYLEQLSGSK